MARVSISMISNSQTEFLKALWCHKKRFDALREHGGSKIFSPKDLRMLVEEFESHWSRIDYIAINLGQKTSSTKDANAEKIHRRSEARFLEINRWLKEMGFRFITAYHSITSASATNSFVFSKNGASKNEMTLVLNEGIARREKSPVAAFVERWGEGIQHIAVDAGRTTPRKEGLRYFMDALRHDGFYFATRIHEEEISYGNKIKQCFTEEIDRGFFFAIVEREGERGNFSSKIFKELHEILERTEKNQG